MTLDIPKFITNVLEKQMKI